MPRTLLVCAGLLAGCAAGGAPPSDSCAEPGAGSIDRLEIAAASSADLAGNVPASFTALDDGDGVPLVAGGQGANMIGFVFRVSGATAPSCLGQRTVVLDGGANRVTSNTQPLTTYAQTDGTRLTEPLWLPGEYPLDFSVTVEAAQLSLTRQLHLALPK
jgi:hypothetical protein